VNILVSGWLDGTADRIEGLVQVAGERVGGGDDVGSAWIWMVWQRRAVFTYLRMDQPARFSIQRPTARPTKAMVRWASIESLVRWYMGPGLQVALGHPE
jgi:hypothetical protein